MYDLGEKVYFYELKTKKVKSGIVTGCSPSQSGYKLIFVDGVPVDESHVFSTEAEAKARKEFCDPIIEGMEKIQKECQEVLDIEREKMIGKPKYKYLIKKAGY